MKIKMIDWSELIENEEQFDMRNARSEGEQYQRELEDEYRAAQKEAGAELMPAPEKIYLGDSVYAEFDGGDRIILTTENGYPDDPRNRIVLEPEVRQALMQFVASLLPRGEREAEYVANCARPD